MLDIKLLQQITIEDINDDTVGNCDNDTMGFYVSLPESIQREYEKYLPNTDGTMSDRRYIEDVWCEYWVDEKSFHWQLHFGDDYIQVDNDFKCEYIENLVLERYKKQYMN